ncbi:hypothetical protein [uncultured Methanobrevibacter sp.]|uniref:hypothetical protein n=1 Tax=uncultured Methanobrevibacter sp. TaxID=253161 RepID=UPI0025FA1779|nr:hypothetical protein [uncultured Methanobrevibacter sp.]
MTTATLEYRVYGLPIESKSVDTNDDGTLTIVGVASTTNKDYANEIVSPEVLESLARQAVGINIYRDHNRKYDGGIGSTVDAWIQDNQLWIKAIILSEFAAGIKERLDIGMNFGFSISGFPKKQRTPEGLLIVDYDLKDITLTYIPVNWDTYGTVEYKSLNLIASNCLTGACYHAINNEVETMENKDNDKIEDKLPEEPVEDKSINDDAGLSDAQLAQVKDMINESYNEFEGRIVEVIEPKLEPLAESAATKAAEDVANRILAEIKATQETNSNDSNLNEKDLNEDEEDEEQVDETEVVESEVDETAAEKPDEEEKSEPGISEPTTGKPEEEDEDEDKKIEEKSLDEKIHDEIVKQLNEKSGASNFGKFKQSQTEVTPKIEEKPAKRDVYGRNLNFV